MMRRAFTLVELLVVIAVIAILVALLIPAVQAARETARKVQCANNQKQVALATLSYASARGRLPAVYDPRFSRSDVSWRFTILPFLEEQALFDALDRPTQWSLYRQERTGPPIRPAIVPTFMCPSSPEGFHPLYQIGEGMGRPRPNVPIPKVLFDAVSSDHNTAPHAVGYQLPSSWNPEAMMHPGAWYGLKSPEINFPARDWFHYFDTSSGPLSDYERRAWRDGAKLHFITDGLSHTVLVAEDAGAPHLYRHGMRVVDYDAAGGSGHVWPVTDLKGGLMVDWQPRAPEATAINWENGGSQIFGLHQGAHVALCDGAVRFLNEDISKYVVGSLLARDDGSAR